MSQRHPHDAALFSLWLTVVVQVVHWKKVTKEQFLEYRQTLLDKYGHGPDAIKSMERIPNRILITAPVAEVRYRMEHTCRISPYTCHVISLIRLLLATGDGENPSRRGVRPSPRALCPAFGQENSASCQEDTAPSGCVTASGESLTTSGECLSVSNHEPEAESTG